VTSAATGFVATGLGLSLEARAARKAAREEDRTADSN
jgi:hypothetical protein